MKDRKIGCESRSDLGNVGSMIKVGGVLRDLRNLFAYFLTSFVQFLGGLSCHDLSPPNNISIFVDNLSVLVQGHTDEIFWIAFGYFA